jgi:hypothetical protein
MLRDCPALLDPMTEQPFEHKIIPRSCLPAYREVPGALDHVVNGTEEFQKLVVKIVAQAKAVQQPLQQAREQKQLVRQAYLDQVQMARAQKEYYRDMLGGWKKDEYGNETYVEGWMF